MINPHDIKEQLKSNELATKPFELLCAISNTCASKIDLGREFVIRALDGHKVAY